jgi:hypothetical protein
MYEMVNFGNCAGRPWAQFPEFRHFAQFQQFFTENFVQNDERFFPKRA